MNLFQNLALKYSHTMMEKSLQKGFNVELLKQPKEKIPKQDKSYMLYAH
ncbi:coproporphyrinogen III oxidase family protein, partial [Campylobacter jejuni]